EKAVSLDPESYELRFNLGMAYSGAQSQSDNAIKAFEAAEAIEPDHLELQTELGRQYLLKGNADKALEHLRVALQTRDYRKDDPMAAVAEHYLARALQLRGYEQAAIDVYQRLLDRLDRGGLPARISPELAYLVMRPEEVAARLGELYEKRGQYDAAVDTFEFVAEHRPEMFDAQNRIVQALLKAGRNKEASERATDVVKRFKASNESIKLLKQAYEKQGGNAAVADQLKKLYHETPNDRSILYALVDVLSDSKRDKEAIEVLDQAARRNNYDSQSVDQLFRLYDKAGDTGASARLLIVALARRPDAIRDLGEEWTQLLRYSRRNRITISRLQTLQVPPEAQASKLLWISRLAQLWGRDILARNSLEQSVKFTPPFPPSYRVLVVDYATRAEWDNSKRERETQTLIDSVRSQGQASLATELEGLVALTQGRGADAAKKFAQAMKLGGNSIDLRLSYATALRGAGDEPKAQQTLWKLASDEPNCEDAFAALFRGYIEQREPDQAMTVLQKWLSNNPNSVNAKVVQAAVLLQARQQDRAQKVLLDLFEREPDNAEVLSALNAFYQRTGKLDEFISKLEAERTKHPENRVAIEYLVNIYAAQKRQTDAIRILDATRTAVAGDADLLYYVGSLYARVEQKKTQEEILQEIVQKSPDYAPASNDLGYTWADRGDNLNRAEELVRVALREEPDNQSYLDSLGWVLYKRGKFAEARKYLEEAIAPASFPDPIVLDHLGDALYRLGDKPAAIKRWKHSQERLGQSEQEREEFARLRLQLRQKITQAEANQTVTVAPTAAPQK
ncbi:MAG TPA: tetratricopeptide repeat protein, partial [Tepidisphaeraceae bacterium]